MEIPKDEKVLSPIYLDFNATTPVAPEVIKIISETLADAWGNPSSGHLLGRKAKSIIDDSRINISAMIGAKPEDIIFTSGGTEANNLALYSAIEDTKKNNKMMAAELPHVITSNVEHDSVIKVLRSWECNGTLDLSVAPVDKDNGCLSIETVIPLIKPTTCLISVMHANNETGILMPISEIGNYLESIRLERELTENCRRIFLHSDAAQTIGKIPVDVAELKVDYLTIVGHKFYGPRIGALFAKNSSSPLHPILYGGGQENGYRSGTENTPMIAGLGCAAKLVSTHLSEYTENMLKCQEQFSQSLLSAGIGCEVNFIRKGNQRLPNTVSFAVPLSVLASEVLEKCTGKIYASLGAACHSGINLPSAILIASGLSPEESRRTIRFSMGRETTLEEIRQAVDIIIDGCHQLLLLRKNKIN